MSAAPDRPALRAVAPNGPADQELIDRCLAGDDGAFAAIVGRYQRMVFAVCYRSIGHRGDAEDLAQEVFIRVHHGLGTFRRGAPLKPWIHRIAFNRVLSFFKARAARRETQDCAVPEHAARLPGPERDAEIALAFDRLSAAIAGLPKHYRDVLVMRNLMGMTYDEMADALGISVGLVKTHLFRARKALQSRERSLLSQLSGE